MNRKKFLQTSGMILAGGLASNTIASNRFTKSIESNLVSMTNNRANTDFKIMDLHVHRSDNQTIEDIATKSKELGILFGVMENIAPWGIQNNNDLKKYLDAVKPYPVYVGLQPMSLGWSSNLSPELIAEADYILMDPQVVKNGNGYGETINLWDYDSYIDDPEAFMEVNMKYYMDILTGEEPLNIFACPLFLPVSIQKEYYKLWTKKRLQQIIDAAHAKKVAIEINDLVRVPHVEFILMAKRAGLKFTFGSDTRDHKTGRLDYCKYIAEKCKLTKNDFYFPKREL